MQLKRWLIGLLFLPSLTWGSGSVTIGGSGSGSLVVNSNANLDMIAPATTTASFPFGLTASTVTVSSNTILPGATFYNNAVLLGGSNQSVTISSNVILSGATFYQGGPILLGGSSQSVTVSSNVVTPGATIYQNGNVVMGGGTIALGSPGNAITISSNTVFPGTTIYANAPMVTSSITYNDATLQGTAFIRTGTVVGFSCTSVTAATTTAVNGVFVNSNITASIIPKKATDQILLATSFQAVASNLAGVAQFTIGRNASGAALGTNTAAANGYIYFQEPVAGNAQAVSFIGSDLPNAATSTSYTVQMRVNGGSITLTDSTTSSTLCLFDMGLTEH